MVTGTAGAALVRAVESFVINVIVLFCVLASGFLGSVDLNDHHAVWTALTAAAVRAVIVAVQELTGASTARVVNRP